MIKRGEIYWVDWSPGRGSEQIGTRPALIVQNNIGNQYSTTTVVAAISTEVPEKAYPFHVRIAPGHSGLTQDSVIKCEQIMTIDRTRLKTRAGQLNEDLMKQVDIALHRSLGLLCPGVGLAETPHRTARRGVEGRDRPF